MTRRIDWREPPAELRESLARWEARDPAGRRLAALRDGRDPAGRRLAALRDENVFGPAPRELLPGGLGALGPFLAMMCPPPPAAAVPAQPLSPEPRAEVPPAAAVPAQPRRPEPRAEVPPADLCPRCGKPRCFCRVRR